MNRMSEAGIFSRLRPISSDSHVTEPPSCYQDRIDPKFRATAPRLAADPVRGDLYVIEGLPDAIPIGMIAAAGADPTAIKLDGRFEDMHRGGWDGKARLADMDRDGVAAEICYPTVGMVLCNHPDPDYKNACFRAYNGWLQEFVADGKGRLFGIGQTAARSPTEMVDDLQRIKEAGFIGVMLPGIPIEEDYDSRIYDPVWKAAVELKLPLSFHVLTSKNDTGSAIVSGKCRGPKLNGWMSFTRACQDIIGMFIFSGVFDRHPELKLVTVEADAGWVPHYMYRMDHAYSRHRHWMKGRELQQKPSEYFRQNVYTTFQDDYIAFKTTDLMNSKRLLWASDFPHSDSTWPHSREVVSEQTQGMKLDLIKDIVHNNAAELYQLSV